MRGIADKAGDCFWTDMSGGGSISWVWTNYKLRVVRDKFQGTSDNVIMDECGGRNDHGVYMDMGRIEFNHSGRNSEL